MHYSPFMHDGNVLVLLSLAGYKGASKQLAMGNADSFSFLLTPSHLIGQV